MPILPQNKKTHLMWVCFLFFLLSYPAMACSREIKTPQAKISTSFDVLILYDGTSEWRWVGYLDGVFLANLLGHFQRNYKILPVEQYSSGLIEQFETTFYLGTFYNNPLPASFINDANHTSRDLIWFKYNLWQLSQVNPDFLTKYGFVFDYIDTSGYEQVVYKNTQFVKSTLDKELGRISILKPELVQTVAYAQFSDMSQLEIPYIIHSKNLWYVADIPFSYVTENDRYLVFCDILHDMLHYVKSNVKQRAMIRLEDIDPTYDTFLLKKIADYLYEQQVPFFISVIPSYHDPLGYFHHGVPYIINMTDRLEFIETLHYMISKGGHIILHGYTHQYGNIVNPYVGVSGADYEFYRVLIDPISNQIIHDEPLFEDSKDWVKTRVEWAEMLLKDSGFDVLFWETPHYAASWIDNQFFARHFSAVFGRVSYFDEQDQTHHAEQFFPYLIHKDYYGGRVIPENMGCVVPYPWYNYPSRSVDDILESAKKNLVVRDALTSMYYHPFLGLSYLQQLISGVKKLGYEFVGANDLT